MPLAAFVAPVALRLAATHHARPASNLRYRPSPVPLRRSRVTPRTTPAPACHRITPTASLPDQRRPNTDATPVDDCHDNATADLVEGALATAAEGDMDTETQADAPAQQSIDPFDAFALSSSTVALAAALLLLSPAGADAVAMFPALTTLRGFLTGPHFIVAFSLGAGALVQTLTGFGFAIIAVCTLTQQPWIANSSVLNAVQPVAATLGAMTGWLQLLPELRDVDWAPVTVLSIAASLTTPLGAALIGIVDARLVVHGLGLLIAGYVVYSLAGIRVPRIAGGRAGAAGLGMLAGALGGMLDLAGPPLVIHADAARWDTGTGQFRRNMLATLSVNSTVIVLCDLLTGRLNDFYYSDFMVYGIPASIAGILVGRALIPRVDAPSLRKLILGVCFFMGVRLLVM